MTSHQRPLGRRRGGGKLSRSPPHARAPGPTRPSARSSRGRPMSEPDLAVQLDEQRRLVAWLQDQLDRQRKMNGELRRAVADLARTFQESLAAAYEAGESGDI